MRKLSCYGNRLTELPALPENLIELDCAENKLTSLPPLPNTLVELSCWKNKLTSLPPLPAGLDHLWCCLNKFQTLPVLPEGLTYLSCDSNQLTSLPPLPETLTILSCERNRLTSLPPLPMSLTVLRCRKKNQFEEPFKTWVEEFDNVSARLDVLRERVHDYWRKLLARDLMNLMVTVGRRELQAQMGNPRDETKDRVQDCLNADCLSVIASFLTGEKGSVIQQSRKLYERVHL